MINFFEAVGITILAGAILLVGYNFVIGFLTRKENV